MSQVTVATTLAGGVLDDATDSKVEAIKALIEQYIPGAGKVSKGILLPGDENVSVPGVQLQARSKEPKMLTTAKYRTLTTVDFVFYQADDNPEEATVKVTNLGQIFEKLFSNNALGDLQGGSPTFSFKQYSGFWVTSEMTRVQFSPTFKYGKDSGPKYVCLGYFTLRLETVQIA